MDNNNKLKNKNVETYTEDMVKAIGSDKGGLIKKIIHEQEELEALKKNVSPESKRNKLFVSISIVLLFFSFIIFSYLLFFNKTIKTVPISPQFTSLIFTDQNDFEPIDGLMKDKIAATFFNQANNTEVRSGGVDGIYLTENQKIIGFKEFITRIQGNFNLSQVGFVNDSFLLGAVNEQTKDPFILLKVSSFSDMFPVMRSWENKMLSDLHGFFGVDISSDTNYLFTKDWQDGIVANKNARILEDNNGNIILMYIFLNDSSIIITNSEAATTEVISRLASSAIKQ